MPPMIEKQMEKTQENVMENWDCVGVYKVDI